MGEKQNDRNNLRIWIEIDANALKRNILTFRKLIGPNVKVGDEVVLIGKQGKEEITAYEWAEKLNTSHYEVVTRINPLIKRVYS